MPSMTRALLPVLVLVASAVLAVPVTAGESRFMSQPDVRGDVVVFAWEGDLYRTGLEGGTAVRLTSHPGDELAPKLSPDGKWIAYTSVSDNVADVWLMPSEGGARKRLTWPPLGGQVVAWTPDSRSVVFRSRFGVAPVRKGNQDYYWKRYKGGQYPDLWSYDSTTKVFKPVTDYVGRNTYPMWVGDTMFFGSDRGPDGITNLWAQELATGAVRQVTSHTDFDVMTGRRARRRS